MALFRRTLQKKDMVKSLQNWREYAHLLCLLRETNLTQCNDQTQSKVIKTYGDTTTILKLSQPNMVRSYILLISLLGTHTLLFVVSHSRTGSDQYGCRNTLGYYQ